ncbi:hypothetical protein V1478_012231 [Vespula squamosa]|uniref:Uncharacterized protein n=1 Tax=Vespula squamosa TaxID=30214 RepID=A0ABD2AFA1_VESSQ
MRFMEIRIVHWRSLATRDDNKVGPLDDFVDFWRSFALTFDECTSQLPRDAFHGNWNCALVVLGYAKRQQSRTFGRLCRFLAQFCFDFRRVHIAASTGCIRIVHWRSLATRNDNKVGPLDDFVDFWRSFALTFDECTSQLPRDAFHGNWNSALVVLGYARRQQSRTFGRLCRFLAQFCFDFRRVHIAASTGCVSWKFELCTGGPWLRETTIKSDLWTTLSISGAVFL